jgi:pimeloyl-ACP methyl ester carboxylesterase
MKARSVAIAALALVGLTLALARSAEPPTGLQPEVRVRGATRLDWAFAVRAFPPAAARVSAAYDSRAQRYQLFVPATYKATATWPLVVFVSPGDDPLGWRAYGKLCEDSDVLFCAAYAAGNNCPPGRRARLVLDVLDDVRRRYRIDPDRTYLVGFGGGATLACALAFALPEHFGGVVAIGGAGPMPRLAHQRRRVRERLSLAFVTGATDFKRRELEDYAAPLFTDLGVRTRLWVVPKLGHALPPTPTLAAAYAWLEDDLKRRSGDAAARPGLAASADELIPSRLLAARSLELAEADLRKAEHTARAVSQMEMIVARWEATEAAEKAEKKLRELRGDARARKLLREQGGAEERRALAAQARAEERFGQARAALLTWRAMLKAYPDAREVDKIGAEIKRLGKVVARLPYLGATFEGDTTTVRAVVPGGPAYRGGLRRGDEVLRLGTVKVARRADVERAFRAQRPGDKLAIEARRGGKAQTFTVLVGSPPLE